MKEFSTKSASTSPKKKAAKHFEGQTLRKNHPNCSWHIPKTTDPKFCAFGKTACDLGFGGKEHEEIFRSTIFANFLWLSHIVSKDIGTVETAGAFFFVKW